MGEDQKQSEVEGWFILELMGHNRIAGYVRTVSLGGDAFFRVDVPEIKFTKRTYSGFGSDMKAKDSEGKIAAFSKFFSTKAIYGFTPVSEEVARQAMQSFRTEPVNTFEIRQAALPAPEDDFDNGSSGSRDEDQDELF